MLVGCGLRDLDALDALKLKSNSTKYVGGSAATRWVRSSERAHHQGNVRSQSQDRTGGAKCYQGPKIARQEQPDPKDPPEDEQARDPANALHIRRRLAWRWRGGDFYLTEIIIDIYPPPVASSPLDRGWHIALTPLRASAIRDYLDVRAMNECPAKALELVGSIAGDDDKVLSHGSTPPWVRQTETLGGRGRAAPAHGIPSHLLRRVTCAPRLGSRALVLLSACGGAWNR